jgi:AcrR family transcriptional regulator
LEPSVDHDRFRRTRLAEIQRTRLIAGMIEAVDEHGAANVAVAHVVACAGVSRRTFYEVFEDCEDCFVAAFDHVVERVERPVLEAYEREQRWHERLRAGLSWLLRFLEEEPAMGQLAVVESLRAGPEVLRHRTRVLARLTAAVEAGRAESSSRSELLPLAAEGVVGAISALLHDRLSRPHPEPLIELLNPLMSLAVLPYLGPAASRRELAGDVPAQVAPRVTSGDLRPEIPMRITYRTVSVLSFVAANPGASNRAVGDGTGMTDQGQVSKLLARLRRIGLLENSADLAERGKPNAWRLTATGKQVQLALDAGGDGLPGKRAAKRGVAPALDA